MVLAILIGIVLFFSAQVKKMLGDSGIKITTRIMGLILAAIAIGMIASGLKVLLPGLA